MTSSKRTTMKSAIIGMIFVLCAIRAFELANAQLSEDYYNKTCPQAQGIVLAKAFYYIDQFPGLAGKILRLCFHDCFVLGCDASVLCDGPNSEKTAIPNVNSLAGFEYIDDVKAALEAVCPGIVSCADIIQWFARDLVLALFTIYGNNVTILNGFYWPVLLGRKDQNVSLASNADVALPSPHSNYTTLVASFAKQNLTAKDMVVLSGAHTIGTANCTISSSRFYNFTGNGLPDKTLNATIVPDLQRECPKGIITKRIGMKNFTDVPNYYSFNGTFDYVYFRNVLENKGLFTSDAALITNSYGKGLVKQLASGELPFIDAFVESIQKMIVLNVTIKGTVRRNCRICTTS